MGMSLQYDMMNSQEPHWCSCFVGVEVLGVRVLQVLIFGALSSLLPMGNSSRALSTGQCVRRKEELRNNGDATSLPTLTLGSICST